MTRLRTGAQVPNKELFKFQVLHRRRLGTELYRKSGGSRSDCGCCVDLIPVVGYEADMYGVAARNAFTKPEEQAAICAEAFEIGWPGGPFLPSKSKRSLIPRGASAAS